MPLPGRKLIVQFRPVIRDGQGYYIIAVTHGLTVQSVRDVNLSGVLSRDKPARLPDSLCGLGAGAMVNNHDAILSPRSNYPTPTPSHDSRGEAKQLGYSVKSFISLPG